MIVGLCLLMAMFSVEATDNPASLCDENTTTAALDWIVAQQHPTTGFVYSFDAPDSETWATDKSYSYDQAVAAIALLLNSPAGAANSVGASDYFDTAETLLTAMSGGLYRDGVTGYMSVPKTWDTSDGSVSSSSLRSDNIALVGYAFALHWLFTGKQDYAAEAEGISKWLYSRLKDAGGATDGRCVQGSDSATYCTTEHNVASFFTFHLVSYLVNATEPELSANLTSAAADVALALQTPLWLVDRFNMGLSDASRSLLAQTWGTLFLMGGGMDDLTEAAVRAAGALTYTEEKFRTTQVVVASGETADGYGSDADSSNSYHSDSVWSEGSLTVALAYFRGVSTTGSANFTQVLSRLQPVFNATSGGVLEGAAYSVVNADGSDIYPYAAVGGTGELLY